MELVCSGVCDVSMLGSGCLHPPSECSKTLFKTLLQLKTEAWHYQFILSSKVVSLKWLNHLSFGSMTLPRRLMGQIIENAGHKRRLETEHRCQTEVSLLRNIKCLKSNVWCSSRHCVCICLTLCICCRVMWSSARRISGSPRLETTNTHGWIKWNL